MLRRESQAWCFCHVCSDLVRSRGNQRAFNFEKILPGGFEPLTECRRVTLVRFVDVGGYNRFGVQVHGLLGLAGEVSASFFHFGDPSVLVIPIYSS